MSVPSAQRIVAVPGTLMVSGRTRYMGMAWDATADAAADITLYDDVRATAANRLDGIRTTTFASGRQWYGPQGIICEAGIFFGALTGALTVTLYYIPQVMGPDGTFYDMSSDQRVVHPFLDQSDLIELFSRMAH